MTLIPFGSFKPVASSGVVTQLLVTPTPDTSSKTTYTFTSAIPNRAYAYTAVIAIGSGSNPGNAVTACTVAGVSATISVENSPGSNDSATICIASIPSNTSGNLVITFASAVDRCVVSVAETKRVTGSLTPTATGVGTGQSAGVMTTASYARTSGGITFVAAAAENSTGYSVPGDVNVIDSVVAGTVRMTFGYIDETAATSRTSSITYVTNANFAAIVGAAYNLT